ncbi:hypothetical protein CBR_g54642 [Chara braunii]|uniref:Uncharacterized protein n=1 Tax=Chara braunii TaxID=69332 RepID=A0A388MCB2_CHABU|nr:hypothetical protein CBR_g54642 [Chara braunii]|eukprot:GBG92197.1 hypothetical protein CBR_g54642 [Chara braunii]
MFEEGPWITTILNYDGGDEMRLRINVEGGKEVEMRTNGKLQDAIMETKDRVERRCQRDGVTARMEVTVSYHETETSMGTADLEQAHVDRDSGGESEMSEAGDGETDLRSWIRPGEIQKHHRAVKPVEEGLEASSRQLTPRGRGTARCVGAVSLGPKAGVVETGVKSSEVRTPGVGTLAIQDAAMTLHGYRPYYWYHQIRWKPMFEEGPWITAILNYDGGDEMRLRINVEGGKEVEMRTNGKLQYAITETKDRVEGHCRWDGVTARMQVTVSYHETETSMDTADLEQAHVDRDSGGEREMSEAGDRETDLRS